MAVPTGTVARLASGDVCSAVSAFSIRYEIGFTCASNADQTWNTRDKVVAHWCQVRVTPRPNINSEI